MESVLAVMHGLMSHMAATSGDLREPTTENEVEEDEQGGRVRGGKAGKKKARAGGKASSGSKTAGRRVQKNCDQTIMRNS